MFQAGWSVPVELIIGHDVGISYTASQGSQVRTGDVVDPCPDLHDGFSVAVDASR